MFNKLLLVGGFAAVGIVLVYYIMARPRLGTDYAGFGAQVGGAVKGFREFQIPEDMRRDYGYPEITDEDRKKIFGGNLAGLRGIEPKRRI